MLLITRSDIGAAAWDRIVRTHVVTPLTREHAVPRDVAATSETRSIALSPATPSRCAVTGLSALWLLGHLDGECPLPLRVVVPRGRHPDPPRGWSNRDWDWHTDGRQFASATTVAGVAVVSTAHAIATALRLDDHRFALPAAARAIRGGGCSVRAVDDAMEPSGRRFAECERQLAAWHELRRVILESDASRR
jgi:hypothetical protein